MIEALFSFLDSIFAVKKNGFGRLAFISLSLSLVFWVFAYFFTEGVS